MSESEDGSDVSEYEDLTPADIYRRLKIAWMNEKTSPEILHNDEDITEVLLYFVIFINILDF